MDSQRSVAYVIGPYVKQGAVVSSHYSNANMLRTIVDVLGVEPMELQAQSCAGPDTWLCAATAACLSRASRVSLATMFHDSR
jgi:hypothetical protein